MLKGHMGGINALCLLPNGHLASGSNDASIRLWDVAARTECSGFGSMLRSVPRRHFPQSTFRRRCARPSPLAGDCGLNRRHERQMATRDHPRACGRGGTLSLQYASGEGRLEGVRTGLVADSRSTTGNSPVPTSGDKFSRNYDIVAETRRKCSEEEKASIVAEAASCSNISAPGAPAWPETEFYLLHSTKSHPISAGRAIRKTSTRSLAESGNLSLQSIGNLRYAESSTLL